jgi:hypothetical protein
MHRYVVLNPCRAGLTYEPLAWPLCSYLDDVGLSDDPVRKRVRDVAGHHAYVTSDDRVRRQELPVYSGTPLSAESLARGVSQATRTPLRDVTGRGGRARTLLVRAARELNGWGVRRTGRELGIARSTVADVHLVADPGVAIVARWASSPTVAGLDDEVLRVWLDRSKYSWMKHPPRRREGCR